MKLFIFLLLSVSGLFASIGNVASMIGDAKVVRASGDVTLKISDAIEESDVIMTQGRTRVQVILKDDTVITIGPNSEFSFEKFNNSDKPEVVMKAKRGFFRAMSGHIGKVAPQRFKIKTRSATIGIRGTHFMGQIGANSEKIACIRGAITVQTPSKMYEVPAGEMVIMAQGTWEQQTLQMKQFKHAKTQVDEKSKKKADSAEDEKAADEVGEEDGDTSDESVDEGVPVSDDHEADDFLSEQVQQEAISAVEDLVDLEKVDDDPVIETPEVITPSFDAYQGTAPRPETEFGTLN